MLAHGLSPFLSEDTWYKIQGINRSTMFYKTFLSCCLKKLFMSSYFVPFLTQHRGTMPLRVSNRILKRIEGHCCQLSGLSKGVSGSFIPYKYSPGCDQKVLCSLQKQQCFNSWYFIFLKNHQSTGLRAANIWLKLHVISSRKWKTL